MWMRSKLGAAMLCAGLVACGSTEATETDLEPEPVSLDTATQALALEVNEDGSDEDVADATAEEPELVRDPQLSVLRDRLLARYDADSNGELDETERANLEENFGDGRRAAHHLMRRYRRELLRRLYDADDSGKLEPAERDELHADLEARLAARREQIDTDGDGEVSDAEWQVFVEARKAAFKARHALLLANFDADGDGKLGPLERRAAHDAMLQRLKQRRARLAEEFDTNDDGRLDAAERASLEDHLKSRVRGEHFGGH